MRTAAVLLLCSFAAAASGGDSFDRAVSAELARVKDLTQEGYPPPYYVGLTSIDVDFWEERWLFGEESFADRYQERFITPDVRVGGYDMDNHPSGEISGVVGQFVGVADDEFALRHSLWLAMDSFFKKASADFLRKQAQRETRGKTEYDTDDLSREAPRRRLLERPKGDWDRDRDALAESCRAASAVFRRAPWLLEGEVSARALRAWSRLRDTEGSAVDFPGGDLDIEITAAAMAPDGLRIEASRRFAAASPSGLPSAGLLKKAAEDVVSELEELRVAPSTSPFSAPALIDPSISAAVVLAIGSRLSGEEARSPSGAQTFRGKMGKSVMRSDFSLFDDPAQAAFSGRPLLGHYEYDDQGVPPSKAVLIDRGVLRGLLLSRYPAVGFPHSNGHGRGPAAYAPQGAPGVLTFATAAPLSDAAMLSRLRAECRRRGKRYGIWARGLRAFAQQQDAADHAAIRLMPERVYLVDAKTGKLTLTRNLDVVGTPLVLLSNILAAGADAQANDMIYNIPTSVIAPSLLLSEAELQRSEAKPERLPILPAPQP